MCVCVRERGVKAAAGDSEALYENNGSQGNRVLEDDC